MAITLVFDGSWKLGFIQVLTRQSIISERVPFVTSSSLALVLIPPVAVVLAIVWPYASEYPKITSIHPMMIVDIILLLKARVYTEDLQRSTFLRIIDSNLP